MTGCVALSVVESSRLPSQPATTLSSHNQSGGVESAFPHVRSGKLSASQVPNYAFDTKPPESQLDTSDPAIASSPWVSFLPPFHPSLLIRRLLLADRCLYWLDLEVQGNQAEHQGFKILDEVIKHPKAFRVRGLGDIDQRANLGRLRMWS